jgi:hypothetical protein
MRYGEFFVVLLCMLAFATTAQATKFNTEKAYPQFQIGVSGIKAKFEPGAKLVVTGAVDDAPADGKVQRGDVIVRAGGYAITGPDPRRPLGEALMEAEASDGQFTLKINRGGSKEKVVIEIPQLGDYSDTWPLNCEKSEAIVTQTANRLARSQNENGWYQIGRNQQMKGGLNGCMATLFLMSTGDNRYTSVVQRFVLQLARRTNNRPTRSAWHAGYRLMVMGEYYLKTGDQRVLPAMQKIANTAAEGQIAGSWGHSLKSDTVVGYVQSGQMNNAGATMFLGLSLARECGIRFRDNTFQKARQFFYRMVGHASIPYGDHRPEIYLCTNGRTAAIACAMGVLPGETYQRASEHYARMLAESYAYPEGGHTGGGFNVIWRGIASSLVSEQNKKLYRTHMDQLDWFYTLCRRPGGGFKIPPSAPHGEKRYTGKNWGYSVALTYTAPRQNLRMLGGKRTQHSVTRSLPSYPWGRKRDRIFLSDQHAKGYGEQTDPPHVIIEKVKGKHNTPAQYLAQQMRHANPTIRTWAAQTLATRKTEQAYRLLEQALQHNDPRVRRAACDGISNYTNWDRRHKQLLRRRVVSQRFVPHIEQILNNAKSAYWEVDGALWALGHAQPRDIRANAEVIRQYGTHDEWWLREAAYWAVVGLQQDIRHNEFLFLGEMLMRSRSVFERGSYDQGLKSVLNSTPNLRPRTKVAYARVIRETLHSAMLESGYDRAAARHEATHRIMMVLKKFDNPPYELLIQDMVKYMDKWEPGAQHSNWMITGSGWQIGLVEVVKRVGRDAGPLVAAFQRTLDRINWNEYQNNDKAKKCARAMRNAIKRYKQRY